MENLLPIGSIVMLKDGEKKLMIYGRLQRQKEGNRDKVWDYVGCLYPEGNISEEFNYLFDHEQIESIFFIGFQDADEFLFKEYLKEQMEGCGLEQYTC